jgi:hypothetical protein
MFEDVITVMPGEFGESGGDALYLDMRALRKDFGYCGVWYARDKSEESVLTTLFYYSQDDHRPDGASEEIKENSFQQAGRFRINTAHERVWMGARVADNAFAGIRLSDFRKENAYINSKVLRTRAGGAEAVGGGILRGGEAWFAKIGIEDRLGTIDYEDLILFLVLIRQSPPADWMADACLGVEGVPVQVPPCRFTIDRKYSLWNGQNPLDGIKE